MGAPSFSSTTLNPAFPPKQPRMPQRGVEKKTAKLEFPFYLLTISDVSSSVQDTVVDGQVHSKENKTGPSPSKGWFLE